MAIEKIDVAVMAQNPMKLHNLNTEPVHGIPVFFRSRTFRLDHFMRTTPLKGFVNTTEKVDDVTLTEEPGITPAFE